MSDNSEKTLGLTAIPAETFAHDVSVSDRYQSFSRELLRLSIAGIGAIGFLVINASDSTSNIPLNFRFSNFGAMLLVSAVSFLLCMMFSLIHLYVSSDSKACHLKFLRMQVSLEKVFKPEGVKGIAGFSDYWFRDEKYSKLTSPNDRAWVERELRNYLFRLAKRMIFWAAFSLGSGGLFFVLSLIVLIYNKSK